LPSGDLGQAEGVIRAEKVYGKNSPEYQLIKNRLQIKNE